MIDVNLQRLKRGWIPLAGQLRFLLIAPFETLPVGLQPDLELLSEVSVGISRQLGPQGNPVTAEQWVRTKRGWSGLLVDAWKLEQAAEWLRKLEEVNWPVDVEVVDGPRSGGTGLGTLAPEPTSYIAYSISDPGLIPPDAVPAPSARWLVDERATRYITQKAQSWAYVPGRRQYLTRGPDWTVELDDLTWDPALAQALHRRGVAAYVCHDRKPTRLKKINLWPHGTVNCQVIDPDLTWHQRVSLVRQTLLWLPTKTDLAFIRTSQGNTTFNWTHYGYPWPHVTRAQINRSRHLFDRLVPDAHGVQVLTTAHLERAHDLSRWQVTDLPGGRHLVEATDLTPWYADTEPDPATLADARRDFGNMILKPEDLHEGTPDTH